MYLILAMSEQPGHSKPSWLLKQLGVLWGFVLTSWYTSTSGFQKCFSPRPSQSNIITMVLIFFPSCKDESKDRFQGSGCGLRTWDMVTLAHDTSGFLPVPSSVFRGVIKNTEYIIYPSIHQLTHPFTHLSIVWLGRLTGNQVTVALRWAGMGQHGSCGNTC